MSSGRLNGKSMAIEQIYVQNISEMKWIGRYFSQAGFQPVTSDEQPVIHSKNESILLPLVRKIGERVRRQAGRLIDAVKEKKRFRVEWWLTKNPAQATGSTHFDSEQPSPEGSLSVGLRKHTCDAEC